MGCTGAPGGTPRLRAEPRVSLRVSSTCGYRHVSEEQQGTWKRPTLGPDRGRAVNGQRAESQESVLVPSNCQGATGRCTCEVLALGPGPYGTRAHRMPLSGRSAGTRRKGSALGPSRRGAVYGQRRQCQMRSLSCPLGGSRAKAHEKSQVLGQSSV